MQVQDAWARATIMTRAPPDLHDPDGAAEALRRWWACPRRRLTELHEMAMDGNVMRMRWPIAGPAAPESRAGDISNRAACVMLLDLKAPLAAELLLPRRCSCATPERDDHAGAVPGDGLI